MRLRLFLLCSLFSVSATPETLPEYVTATHPYVDSHSVRPVPIVLFEKELEQLEKVHVVQCLATMVYGEARGESKLGQIAVAYTAKNRALGVNHNICTEILRPYQYSVFNANPKLRAIAQDPTKHPRFEVGTDAQSWAMAKHIAELVYLGKVKDPTHGATHYYNPELMDTLQYPTPEWVNQYVVLVIIERHHFFKADTVLASI